MKRLSKKQILMLHTQLIQQTGGSDGVRDYNLLDSVHIPQELRIRSRGTERHSASN